MWNGSGAEEVEDREGERERARGLGPGRVKTSHQNVFKVNQPLVEQWQPNDFIITIHFRCQRLHTPLPVTPTSLHPHLSSPLNPLYHLIVFLVLFQNFPQN